MLTWLSEVLPEIKLWEFFYSEWEAQHNPILYFLELFTMIRKHSKAPCRLTKR
jgi:hypothetical protein